VFRKGRLKAVPVKVPAEQGFGPWHCFFGSFAAQVNPVLAGNGFGI
jgi:hypothetical protein